MNDLISRISLYKEFFTCKDGSRVNDCDIEGMPIEYEVRFIRRKLLDAPTVPAIPIPDNATNGDMIMALYKPYKICIWGKISVHVYMTEKDFVRAEYQMNFDSEWWNSPYKRGETNE